MRHSVSLKTMAEKNSFCCQDAAMHLMEESARYDENLVRLYKDIGIAVAGLDYVRQANDFHEVPDDWFDTIGMLLDNIDESMSNMLSIVNQTTRSMTCEQKNKCTQLATVEHKLNHKLDFSSPTVAYAQLQEFKHIFSGSKGQNYISLYQDMVRTKREFADIYQILVHLEEFNAWVHDSRHYLNRMRVVLKKEWRNYISVRNLHAMDALENALFFLKQDFNVFGQESGFIPPPFEPYRLFHKFQFCFPEEFDRTVWVRTGDDFQGQIYGVNGIETVVLNIYANAAKYLPNDDRSHNVETRFERNADSLRITVKSMGPYVPSNELGKIFEPEKRASTANLGSKSGSGLGLARVKSICENAGYTVWAESDNESYTDKKWGDFSINIIIPSKCILRE